MARLISLKDWHGQILNVDVEIDWGPENAECDEVLVISTSDESNGAEIALQASQIQKLINTLQTGLDKLQQSR